MRLADQFQGQTVFFAVSAEPGGHTACIAKRSWTAPVRVVTTQRTTTVNNSYRASHSVYNSCKTKNKLMSVIGLVQLVPLSRRQSSLLYSVFEIRILLGECLGQYLNAATE